MMVSTVSINGKDRPLVTAKGEAMCWTIYANCYKKWALICREIKEDPKWTIPKFKGKEKSTHPYYDTRWSDNSSGKVSRGGWKPEAFVCFNTYTQTIINFRKADNSDKWKMYKLAKKILRKKYNVTAKSYTGKRKRKSSAEATRCKFDTMVDQFINQIACLRQY